MAEKDWKSPERGQPQSETRGVVSDVVVPVVGSISTGVASAATAQILAGRKPKKEKE